MLLRGLFLASVAAIALTACGQKPAAEKTGPGEEAASAAAAVDYAANAEAAVANPARPEEDRADDERRKPATAIAFMEVAPGMTVFEIEAGPGWYTELLSYAVGANGKVIMQNFSGFRDYVAAKIDARLANGRLANVTESISAFDALDAADGSVDVATWVQGPHEIYFKPQGQSLGDPVKTYAEIFRILKPGGAFVVIDHSAEAGAPETTGNDLHRIDKAIVLKMATDAGFTLDGESDFLANPQDPLNVGVFDESIRGHTDQFAVRFRKP
jgi:predicted methyltransferase